MHMPKKINRPWLPAAAVEQFRRPMMHRVPAGVRFVEGGEQGGNEPPEAGGEGGEAGEAGKEAGKAGEDGKTFTQAELERIIAGRLAKFSDYDELKSERDRLRDATATEQEKAVEAARKEAAQEATKGADARLKRAESRALAAELGFHDPSEVHVFLDLEQVPMVDGDVDTAALRKTLSEVAEKRPYLLKEPGREAGDVGIGRKGSTPEPEPGVARMESAFDAAFAKK